MEIKSTRGKFSAVLIVLGLVLAILPQGRSVKINPGRMLAEISDENAFYTADQVARMIASEDSTIRFIDLRTSEEFRSSSLPGAVNIPYNKFNVSDLRKSLGRGNVKNILYSDGDIHSSYALALSREMGFSNTRAIKGGMTEWVATVMNSTFSGDRISARENALFEARTKARNIFTEYNSLPDSLKLRLFSFNTEKKKLDGGCE